MKQMTQKRHLIHFLDCLWMHMKHTFHLKENKINKKLIKVTRCILKSVKNKNKLYKSFLMNSSNRNKQEYIKYKNKLNHIIKIAKNSTTKNN